MSELPVVGQGDFRYACVHDWGELPRGHVYGLTHGVAVDGAGRVYVLHTVGAGASSDDTVVVFDPDGGFVTSWGSEFKGSAHGLWLHREGDVEYLYVTDLERGLFKMTLGGEVVWQVAKPSFFEARPQLPYCPSNVAVDPDHNVYLADGYGSYFVFVFDRDGNELGVLSGPGPDSHHTVHPHGIWCDTRGPEPLLMLTENNIPRLHYLSLEGNHVSYLPATVRSPRHVDEHEGLLVIPDLDARVTLLDAQNQPVAQLGDGWTTKAEVRALREMPREHFTPGTFVCPHSAAFDAVGNIYVVEWVTVGRVTKLVRL